MYVSGVYMVGWLIQRWFVQALMRNWEGICFTIKCYLFFIFVCPNEYSAPSRPILFKNMSEDYKLSYRKKNECNEAGSNDQYVWQIRDTLFRYFLRIRKNFLSLKDDCYTIHDIIKVDILYKSLKTSIWKNTFTQYIQI